MQDFIDQAEKNGVILCNNGKCQFCGADVQNGVFECVEIYSNGVHLLDFGNAIYHRARFLSVDAHALQHSEIHGRWSNHFHLTRLNLILEKQEKWDYKKSPLLSNFINKYKKNRPDEILIPPARQKRGIITAKDLTKVTSVDECLQLINNWADEVYHSWLHYHSLVSKIADLFLESRKFNKTNERKTTNR